MPDTGIIVSMGGQTALNVGIELWRNEDLQRRGIRVLGTKIDAIVATEDREIFSTKLREINETLALSYPATTVEGALEAAHKIGYPVLVRAAFTLGGLGSGFAENDAELRRDLGVRCVLHAVDATRVHLTMKWVVSLVILSAAQGPRGARLGGGLLDDEADPHRPGPAGLEGGRVRGACQRPFARRRRDRVIRRGSRSTTSLV